jgi:hypothetical protein
MSDSIRAEVGALLATIEAKLDYLIFVIRPYFWLHGSRSWVRTAARACPDRASGAVPPVRYRGRTLVP